jgi:hypothetical protein
MTRTIGYDFYAEVLDCYLSLLCGELRDGLVSVCLYGSVARGTATLESDIDLLIVVSEGKSSYFEMLQPVLRAQAGLRETEGFRRLRCNNASVYLSCLVFSEVEASQNRNIYLDILDEGIILYDPHDFLKQRLGQFKQRLHELGSRRITMEDGRWYWDLKPDLVPGTAFEL